MSSSDFAIPPFQIDPDALPPALLTSEPGSFAYNTLKVRVPGILDDTIRTNEFPPDVVQNLQALRAEIVGGRIQPLEEETPDREFWNQISEPWIGRSWLDVPWYWAEAYFYRRVLEATRYFWSGPLEGFDPYRAKKLTELAPDMAPRAVSAVLRAMRATQGEPEEDLKRFQALIYASLWGNRVDLSYSIAAHASRDGQFAEEHRYLIADDCERVYRFWQESARRRLIVIADNAGTEFCMDLALIEHILSQNLADEVILHLKSQPFFVSDAMPRDLQPTLDALAAGEPEAVLLSSRLAALLAQDRLKVYYHWFYTTCLYYFQMPEDLRAELARADFVILKGDANYRRLLGDAHWPPQTAFDHVTRFFPAPLLALRTCKSEEVVGLRPGQADELREKDRDYLIDGRWGIVQARL